MEIDESIYIEQIVHIFKNKTKWLKRTSKLLSLSKLKITHVSDAYKVNERLLSQEKS